MNTCYIGIGGNLQQPHEIVKNAINALKNLDNCEFVAASPLYESLPMGPQAQPNYVNAVACINTELSPIALLDATQAIEQAFGRVRKDERWGARTLDLDILLFNNQVINEPRLTVPHYGMKTREFVLYPLADIAPDLVLPDGTAIKTLLNQVPLNDMKKLNP
jgi:2-amino-4-hydroxy-6-hydroxymethyldihydropteridine diphosphokinase